MSKFAIIRQDGEVDVVDGSSVDDVANRFGWPGNGNIDAYDPATYPEVRTTFASPDEQREFLADKPKKSMADKPKKSKNDGGSN